MKGEIDESFHSPLGQASCSEEVAKYILYVFMLRQVPL